MKTVIQIARMAWTIALFSVGCATIQTGPPLVVVVSVDQMRADYLDRFADTYEGGLAALRRGAVFTDAHQDHAFTQTAAGHATISTGLFPQHHGIIANEWFDRPSQQTLYSVADSTMPLVGYPDEPGRSPANLRSSAFGDWLREQRPGSKVFSVAAKDRAAILMGGRRANGAYWYLPASGRFVTSRYYRDGYPRWVNQFNAIGPDRYFGTTWTKLLPDSAYGQSREDNFPAEADGEHTTFPHTIGPDTTEVTRGFYEALLYTPFADELTLAFAREMVINESMGRDATTDILFLGLSATDFIGHRYGPFSQEIEDQFLRLDRSLGTFFAFLDSTVGTGRYTVVLSADHGVLPMPEELTRRGIESRRVPFSELAPALTAALDEALRDSIISERPRVSYNNGLVFRFADRVSGDAARALRTLVATRLRELPAVVDAYTYDELLDDTNHRPGIDIFRRSFDRDRAPDIAIQLQERDLLGGEPTGTSHGTSYDYDTHVPVVLWGAGVTPGRFDRTVRTVDIAPTVAQMLGITPPHQLDGSVLTEAVSGSH
jgi:predicted AlkP superfamily pyrophosphatase or phosphodiesterase